LMEWKPSLTKVGGGFFIFGADAIHDYPLFFIFHRHSMNSVRWLLGLTDCPTEP